MAARVSPPRAFLAGFVVAAACFLAVPSFGQEEDAQQLGVADVLTKQYRDTDALRKRLFRGDKEAVSVNSAEAQLAFDVAAQWFAYRPTWIAFRNEPKALFTIVDEFEREVIREIMGPNATKGNQQAIVKFGPFAAKRFGELFEKKFSAFPLAQVNAAQMLPLLAKLKQEEVGDMLVSIINDKKQHDAVKLYAIKGLLEFFPAKEVTENEIVLDNKEKAAHKKKERNAERVDCLVAYTQRKWPAAMEPDAVRFIRREALASLAQAAIPFVHIKMTKKKDKAENVEGPVAHGLLRALVPAGPDSLAPPTSTQEKIEAVLGVCKLKVADQPAYNPEPGVLLVGLALRDIFDDYNADWININTEKKLPRVAWRLQSERLKLGLQELAANAKGTPAQNQAAQLEKACNEFFGLMQQKGFGKLEQFNLFQDQLIKGWEAKLEKDSPLEIYKGYPKLQIRVTAPKAA